MTIQFSIAKIKQGMNVPHHGRSFHIMKGNAIGCAALFLELWRPQSVVGFVPIPFSICRRLPRVVISRRKRMEALPVLVVARVDQANVKDCLEAACDKDVFHRRMLVGITLGVIETSFGQFPQGGLGQCVAGTARIEKDSTLLALLETPSSKKVFHGGISNGIGQVISQVLRQNVQVFSPLKEEIKVFQIVGAHKPPYRSNLLPHVVVFFWPFMRKRNCWQPRIVPRRKSQESITARSPSFPNRSNVGVVFLFHGIHHAQDPRSTFHLFRRIIDAVAEQIHSADWDGIQSHKILVVRAATDSNFFAQLPVLGHEGRWPRISVLVFSRLEHSPEYRHVGNPFHGLCFFVVVFRVTMEIRSKSRTGWCFPEIL
mmetsp:Transcript_21087/g.45984  ORF Transcript_21087/g.45984 Transcript_21087/m.45984 type:complete len:371 (+) Transcript_21087:528-1640(+)